jgi:FtsP/CotA-like multicopper oxidase with cupredoxin domain
MTTKNITRRNFLYIGAGTVAGAFLGNGCESSPSLSSNPKVRGLSKSGSTIRDYSFRASKFTGAPDGRERMLMGFNEMYPGPMIRATEGDTIRVRLKNDLGAPTTTHWHGQFQEGTWFMDGVSGITQQPIPNGTDFVYEFTANPAGTFWYHSHHGTQYGNGYKGPLIVDEKDPIATYDRDEVLIISDWFLEESTEILDNVNSRKYDNYKPSKMPKMSDGKMKMKMDVADVPWQSGLMNGKGRMDPYNGKEPLATFNVEKGETIRLRLLNTSSTYSFQIRIDGHPMTVIAADSVPVKPMEVDTLRIDIGQRYDVLIRANSPGVHWIRAMTRNAKEFFGVLRYKGTAASEPLAKSGQWGPRDLNESELRNKTPIDLQGVTYREVPFVLGGTMNPYRWSVNGQIFPESEPIRIKKGEVVRFIMKNPTAMWHPFHMHGQTFHVLGNPGNLNLVNPLTRDTVLLKSQETTVIQHQFNNPGRWFFHCHIIWHLAAGMASIIEVHPFQDPRGKAYLDSLKGPG